MSKEILLVVDAVSNEKGVEPEVIFGAIEAALASAAKKRQMEEIECRVVIDRETGEYETFRQWEVIEDPELFEAGSRQIMLEDARKQDAALNKGDFIEEPMDNPEFGRIAAQAAKQVIVQHRVGDLINGIVKRVERGNVYLDLGGNAEAFVPREKMINRESVRAGDRLRGYLYEVKAELRGPQLWVTRSAPEFLIELFKLEVPEIGQGLIDILGAARDPAMRAKIAVRSNDRRTDPIGACVGMRGSRVQAVSNELSGERIDIILYDENPAQFVINAMAPAEVKGIIVDEERSMMDIVVEEDKLSQAIGRGGQNVQESTAATALFVERLDVDEEIANILVAEGFSTVEEVAYVPEPELLAVAEFDETVVEELRSRARDALLTQLIAAEEELDEHEPAADLLALEGMTERIAYELASRGIVTQDDLAECATDELEEVPGLEEELAAALIMAARAPWFADEEE
nr:transcription termination/antitermination protein NusA-like [Nerophis lumbriciformis]